MLIQKLMQINGKECPCKKEHLFKSKIITGRGVLTALPRTLNELNVKKPYVVADKNTFQAAGQALCALLEQADIRYSLYCFEQSPKPDEKGVGSALMHMPTDCDSIIAVGSGVMNDICKILAFHTHLPYLIVATAASMDGYASMTSSVTRQGVKVSLPSRCADVIIGDTDIIKKAPKEMLLAGIGDMLAKYISICEWRIAALLIGEYYCETIAQLVREALARTLRAASGALAGDEDAVNEILDALIVGSVAMNYAGLSRPASGVEHYISHIFDIRGVEFHEKTALHGTQCAIATLAVTRLYERLTTLVPDKNTASAYAEKFDLALWNAELEKLLGKSALPLIENEKTEGKYDRTKQQQRLLTIIEKWPEIVKIIKEEIPSSKTLEQTMTQLGLPVRFDQIGMNRALLPTIFRATKDIRDKYVLSRLLFDIGVLDEFAAEI